MRNINFLILSAILLLSSCGTSKKVLLFQDALANVPARYEDTKGISIKPADQISIIVTSKSPDLAALFNLPLVATQSHPENGGGVGDQALVGYTVDNQGMIDFPVLGKLEVAGLTQSDLQGMIKQRLIDEKYILDPVVTVQFMNFKITMIGEVNAPGNYLVNGDRINIIEALGKANDISINGRRDRVTVVRTNNEERVFHYVDLRSTDLFSSPVYYLQQNDVVYVEPTKARIGQTTINENSFKSVSFWMSLTSFVATMALLIF